MKLDHTPGPFVADPHYYLYVWTAAQKMVADFPDQGGYLARMRGVGRGATVEEQKGNAQLFALAPTAPHECDVPSCPGPETKRKLEAAEDLLRCLKEAVAAWELQDLDESDDSEAGEAMADWKAVIAKAEGRA